MPIIEIYLFKGHSAEVRTRLMNAMTDAFRMVIPAPPAAMTIVLHELERENYMRGGAMRRPATPLPEPGAVVAAFLAALQSGDADALRPLMTEDCKFRMPGAPEIASLEALTAWAQPRTRQFNYRQIGMDAAPGETGPIVYARGVLSGEWPDGTPFEDVSMATRYAFRGGRISHIQIWHDLAEARLRHAVTPGAAPDTDSADR